MLPDGDMFVNTHSAEKWKNSKILKLVSRQHITCLIFDNPDGMPGYFHPFFLEPAESLLSLRNMLLTPNKQLPFS